MPDEIALSTVPPAAASGGAIKSTHGLSLFPPPTSSPLDPLRWPRPTKVLALISAALFNFTANFAGSGLSVASVIFQIQFRKSQSDVNKLMTLNFLLLGLGNMVWVPVSVRWGKRPVLLGAIVCLFAVLIWSAKVKSFDELLAARCLSGFFSSAGESILPGIISDLFFLHERGHYMSLHIILMVSGTAIGPLIAGFMVSYSPNTWRDFMWVCAALSGTTFLLIFFLFPETSFAHPSATTTTISINPNRPSSNSTADENEKEKAPVQNLTTNGNGLTETGDVSVVPISYPTAVWTSFSKPNPNVKILRVFALPFVFLSSLPVLWAVLIYATNLAAQLILIFAFPSLLLAPPYLWSSSDVGLMQVAAIIAFIIAMVGGGYVCDVITSKVILRNKGIFVPEQRLISMAPGSLIAPAGCILVAFACDQSLTWVAIAFGFAMISFGTIYSPSIATTYLLDVWPLFAQEILVVINVFKNLVAFLFIYVAVDWVHDKGWVQVYMIMFMVISVSTLLTVPLYFFGRRIRASFDKVIVKVAGVRS